MEIKEIGKKEFLNFKYELHKNDAFFCDSSFFNLKSILDKSNDFTKRLKINLIAVVVERKIICECLLIDDNEKELYLSYFDAFEGRREAVNFLLAYVMDKAKELKKSRVIIGINGHVSYGVGILQGEVAKKVSFDSLYNKPYYSEYFSHLKKRTLASYITKLDDLIIKFNKDFNNTSYTVRGMNLKKFDEEMRSFAALTNETLNETDFYKQVDLTHMGQLINGLKPFLKSENLLFVEKNGEKVGYLFWHPDFNELFNSGKKTSILKVFVNFIFKSNKIRTVKINAVGIKKEHRCSAAFSLLLKRMNETIAGKFDFAETTYVLDSTSSSKLALLGAGFSRLNEYAVYEMEAQ